MFSLLIGNLRHYWLNHVAVALGVVVGTAVLSGALLIGDSLRGSLRDLTIDRLGKIHHALVGSQFFRARLANEIRDSNNTLQHVAPVILLRGSVVSVNNGNHRRAGQVQIVGVDESFWPLFGEEPRVLENGVIINQALADELGTVADDSVEIRMQMPQSIPADSTLGQRSGDNSVHVPTSPVKEILPNAGAGRFSLDIQQQRPLILYIRLQRLQNRLVRQARQMRGAANALLVSVNDVSDSQDPSALLQEQLRKHIELTDLGLLLRADNSDERYLSLESGRLVVPPAIAKYVLETAKSSGWSTAPTISYLANLIYHDEQYPQSIAARIGRFAGSPVAHNLFELAYLGAENTPYSIVTGLNPLRPPPWGPLQIVPDSAGLGDDEILLSRWMVEDLWPMGNWQDDIGRPVITLQYFKEAEGHLLNVESTTLKFAGVAEMTGPAMDSSLTPDFPGIRGRSIGQWEPPFPKKQWHKEWIRDRDEDYWRQYEATPKAFVSVETSRRLWKGRYGQWTSIRLAPSEGTAKSDLDSFHSTVEKALLQAIDPASVGLEFQPVMAQGLESTESSVAAGFGWLFLGFSFFLILSASLLVILMFRLGIERRAREIGILLASGFTRKAVNRLLLGEGLFVATLGGAIGLIAAIGYARVLVSLLNSWWADSLHTSFLRFHIAQSDPLMGPVPYPSLTIGFVLSVMAATGSIWFAIRGLSRIQPRALLSGQSESAHQLHGQNPWRWLIIGGGIIDLGILLTIISFFLSQSVASPMFFVSGLLFLTGGLIWVRIWVRSEYHGILQPGGTAALFRLGSRNIQRKPGRSLLTAGLIAAATFMVVAVESFRKDSQGDPLSTDSGTGGFTLWAEADVPLSQPPVDVAAINAILPDDDDALDIPTDLFKETQIFGLKLRPGDDVSCMNLYQPRKPRILGVPRNLRDQNRFRFGGILSPLESEFEHPWEILEKTFQDGAIPMIADAHTATWVLQLAVGDDFKITDESGTDRNLRLVGLLSGSIFQSELIISQENFQSLFPSRGGYSFFLIQSGLNDSEQFTTSLESALGERFGFNIGSTAARLASYHAVENTYLSTFQVLGALGLLLGTLGLGAVLLRNIWERQGELALLKSLGFSQRSLRKLIFAENITLLVIGVALGLGCAMASVLPHVYMQGSALPVTNIAGLVVAELIVGVMATLSALAVVFRIPVLLALRQE